MPVVGIWEGTHAKGSCEPGQAGRCSHKQRSLVQWISLSPKTTAGAFFGLTVNTEAYTVLARRYRPQQFRDLVGQEAVARALMNALESNRVAHAYLFTGARGVGKTSTARILAKALNCAKGPTPTPCDRCELCKSIAAGEDVDVLEIDGASNRGIDEVREIRQNVQYRPARSRYKIYIIDEVHMLTAPAFNALLKTLEEPPSHVKFIFATTEPQKIPITILSRCQRFDFLGISTARIVERLSEVVKAEKVQADLEALELVARRAAGSMRDAESLLDQLLAFGTEGVTSDVVHSLLGTAHCDRIIELASAVLTHDGPRTLELFSQSADEGLQLGELLDQLIDYWRDLMVVNCAGLEGRELSVPAQHRETLAQQASSLKLDTILAGLDILSAAKSRLRATTHGRVILEMALVRLTRLEDLLPLSQLAQYLAQPTGTNPPLPRTASSTPASSATRATEPAEKKKVVPDEPAGPRALDAESLAQIWAEVLRQVGPMLASDLGKAGLPAISGPNTLVLRFPVGYNLEREHCQDPARVGRVEEIIRKTTGRPWNIRMELIGGNAAAPTAPAAEAETNSQSRYRRQRAEALQEPLVKRIIDVLDGQIVQIDDGFGGAPLAANERAEPAEGEEG